MKIFNKNSLVLAIACLLAIAGVASATSRKLPGIEGTYCDSDYECESMSGNDCYKCECPDDESPPPPPPPPARRLEEEKPRALRMANEQAAAARNAKRGFESARRAKSEKSCKTAKQATCVFKPSKSGKSCSLD